MKRKSQVVSFSVPEEEPAQMALQTSIDQYNHKNPVEPRKNEIDIIAKRNVEESLSAKDEDNQTHELVNEGRDVAAASGGGGDSEEEDVSGRERLKRHRMEVAGRVWIPDIWGHEELLKDWTDCSAFDDSLFPSGIVKARFALVQECRRTPFRELRC